MRTPHGKSQANRLTQEVIRAELALRTLTGHHAAVIAPMQEALTAAKAQYDAAAQPHLVLLNEALPALARWYLRNVQKYGQRRTIALPSGALEGRMGSSWKVEITGDPEKVMALVEAVDPTLIVVARLLDLRRMSVQRHRLRGIPGLVITKEDRLKITSPLLEDTTAPKTPRLIAVLRRYVNSRGNPIGPRAKVILKTPQEVS